jgi:hypothetical protein
MSSAGGGGGCSLERIVSGLTTSDSYMAGLLGHKPLCVRVERSLARRVLHVSSLAVRKCCLYLRVCDLASGPRGLPVCIGLGRCKVLCSPRRFTNSEDGEEASWGLSWLFRLKGLLGLRAT